MSGKIDSTFAQTTLTFVTCFCSVSARQVHDVSVLGRQMQGLSSFLDIKPAFDGRPRCDELALRHFHPASLIRGSV